jgi:hypothetical protein
VDEYYKEMELLMISTKTTEGPEAVMSWFFNGLHIEVRNRVEMVTYSTLHDLVHQVEHPEKTTQTKPNCNPYKFMVSFIYGGC